MVIKNNKKGNKKNGKKNNKNNKKSNNKKKEIDHYKNFIKMNSKVKEHKIFKSGQIYDLYIISKKFLKRWKKKKLDKEEIINEDLINPNNFQFTEKNLIKNQDFILKNFLEIDSDYILVDKKAWNFVLTKFTAYSIKKSFFYDDEGFLNDIEKGISLNIIINEKGKLNKYLYQLFFHEKLINLFKEILPEKNPEELLKNSFLIDSRIDLKNFEKSLLENKEIKGTNLKEKINFPFSNLKVHDIILINLDDSEKYERNVNLKDNLGFCYNCRENTVLNFNCDCEIVSYCSIDCKYEDHLEHYYLCPKIKNYFFDFENDLKNFSGDFNNGEIGLINIGNSCYLNSLLQILKFIFEPEILKKIELEKIKDNEICLSFYHMMKKLWFTKKKAIRPWFFKIFLGILHESYLGFYQNDAHECFMNIIDSLKESNIPIYKNLIKKFRGYTGTFINCDKCKNSIEKKEKFFVISLPIKSENIIYTIDFYKLEKKNNLNFEFSEQKFTPKNLSTLKSILEQNDFEKGILILANKEKIFYIFSDRNTPINEIYEKVISSKAEGSLYLYPYIFKYYLGINFCTKKPTLDKYFDKKTFLGNFRIMELNLEDDKSISRIKLHLLVFSMMRPFLDEFLKNYDFFEEMEKENNSQDFLNYFYLKLFGLVILNKYKILVKYDQFEFKDYIEEKIKDYEFEKEEKKDKNKKSSKNSDKRIKSPNPKIKKDNKKEKSIEKFKSKSELLEKKKSIWKKEYDNSKKNHEKLLKKYFEDLKKVKKLPNNLIYKINYINKDPLCKNCGKKSSHTCKLLFNDKQINIRTNLIQINLEFEKSDIITPLLKPQFEKEKNIKYYNVDISKKIFTLKSCIDSFCEEEEIEYKCNKCENKTSKMSTKIVSYPEVLVLHLKRFQSVFKKNKLKSIKIEKKVEVPLELNFGHFKYKIMGVVNHRGQLNHGHYTNYSFNPFINKWVFYNDDEVEVIEDYKRINSDLNYILFYKLVNDGEENKIIEDKENDNDEDFKKKDNLEIICGNTTYDKLDDSKENKKIDNNEKSEKEENKEETDEIKLKEKGGIKI